MATSPSLSRPVLKSSLSSPSHTPLLTRDLALPSDNPIDPATSSSSFSDHPSHNGHIHFPPATSTSADRPDRPASAKRASSFQRTATSSSGDLGHNYRSRVGFDTFDDSSEDALFSFTLQSKSADYVHTRDTRLFLVAVSPDESGTEALDWLMESLIEDGDEIVALRVIDWEGTERASLSKQEELREEARELQRYILEKNDEVDGRDISVVVEFVAGKITDSIMRLIALYRPDSLIVGTKGSRGKLAAWGAVLGAPGMGSVSRYCISHSSVPVVVVRPESKVKKSMAKRQKEGKKSYVKLMGAGGGTNLTRSRSAGGLA